jgi:electron transfer flavoprotein alpha subunit
VYVELNGGKPTRGSLGVLSKVREIYGFAAALLCTPEWQDHTESLCAAGATEVYYCDEVRPDDEPESLQIDALVALLTDHEFSTVLFGDSRLTCELAGAVSAIFESGVNWRLEDIVLRDGVLRGTRRSGVIGERMECTWTTALKVAVMRSVNLPLRRFEGGATAIRIKAASHARPRPQFVGPVSEPDASARELARADIVVAGGRGMRDLSTLRLLEELAQVVDGAVGVSMPIVDRGWYPYANQVGSASEAVSPRLYIACGISGSVQHVAGMRDSQLIVAVNTDQTAPIMGLCDVGVVGDLHEIVPRLIELIGSSRAGPPPDVRPRQ